MNASAANGWLSSALRVAGYPARYLRGTIEFFPGLAAACAATGVSDPEQLPAFFRAAGIPCEAIYAGGRLVNLRIEHLWVETLVAQAPLRLVECPIRIAPYLVRQHWHERYHHDPASRWLRALVADAFGAEGGVGSIAPARPLR